MSINLDIINPSDSPNDGRVKINNNFTAITNSLNSPSYLTLSATSISASTLYSGSTNLYSIFVTSADGNDITRVQPGLNTYTGGTGNAPTINISAATLNYLSATTVSASTITSGSTNLYSIFSPALTVSNGLTLTGNALKLGGALTSTTNITGAQSFNLGTTTLRFSQLNSYSTTHSKFFVGNSATTGSYSSLALYGSANNYTSLIQTTDGVNSATVQLTPQKVELIIGASSIVVVSTGETVANNGTTNSMVIDDPNSKGAVYAADYLANFTPESLVSKRYVDRSITGVTSAFTSVYRIEKTLTKAQLLALNSVPIYITTGELGLTATQAAKFHQLDTEWWIYPDGTAFTQTGSTAIVLKTNIGATAITHLPVGEIVGTTTAFTVQSNGISSAYGSSSVIAVRANDGFYFEASGGAIFDGGANSYIKAVLFYEKVNFA